MFPTSLIETFLLLHVAKNIINHFTADYLLMYFYVNASTSIRLTWSHNLT